MLLIEPVREALAAARLSLANGHDTRVADRVTADLLAEAAPDAVIIASPSGLHYEHALMALGHGAPTFVEKPLACTASQANKLRALSRGRLGTTEQRIHRADLRTLGAIVSSGRLGKIRRIEYIDAIAPAPRFASSWRNDLRLSGGGVLLDLGYHTVGVVLWLLGLPAREFAILSAALRHEHLDVEVRADVVCEVAGIEVALAVGLNGERPRERLTVQACHGEIRLDRDRTDSLRSTITITRAGRGHTSRVVRLDPRHDTKPLRDFLAGVVNDGNLNRPVDTVEFLERIYLKASA